jgi:hypothetical protein
MIPMITVERIQIFADLRILDWGIGQIVSTCHDFDIQRMGNSALDCEIQRSGRYTLSLFGR